MRLRLRRAWMPLVVLAAGAVALSGWLILRGRASAAGKPSPSQLMASLPAAGGSSASDQAIAREIAGDRAWRVDLGAGRNSRDGKLRTPPAIALHQRADRVIAGLARRGSDTSL